MALEYILDEYPKTIRVKGGLSCDVRPLEPTDETSFHEFFLTLPTQERMFIKHRVTEPEVIRDWCQNIDLGRNLPLLAISEGQILADATLHQQRSRHDEIPAFRARGGPRSRYRSRAGGRHPSISP